MLLTELATIVSRCHFEFVSASRPLVSVSFQAFPSVCIMSSMSEECEQQAHLYSPFCLGMCEWTDSPGQGVTIAPHQQTTNVNVNNCPPTSSLVALDVLPPSECFNFASEDQLFQLSKGHIPANTARSTEWALKVFRMWKEAWNERFPQNAVPDKLFEDGDPSQLTTHPSQFIVEVRKTNGEFYPSSTLH